MATPVMSTLATSMLGIKHPIVCGGMTATGSAELAAGVSNAGCLGMRIDTSHLLILFPTFYGSHTHTERERICACVRARECVFILLQSEYVKTIDVPYYRKL